MIFFKCLQVLEKKEGENVEVEEEKEKEGEKDDDEETIIDEEELYDEEDLEEVRLTICGKAYGGIYTIAIKLSIFHLITPLRFWKRLERKLLRDTKNVLWLTAKAEYQQFDKEKPWNL